MRVLSSAAMVSSAPLIAFWLIGDRSRSGDPRDLDYLMRVPVVASTIRLAGLAALAVFISSSIWLQRHPTETNPWSGLVAVLVVVGVAIAAGLRMATSGVIGANIGGALFLAMGLPLCLVIAFVSVVRAVQRSGALRSVGVGRSRSPLP